MGRGSGKVMLLTVPPDPGRKWAHLVLVTHHGGGWYRAQCMGEAKRCRAGKCPHVTGLGLRGRSGVRPIRPMPREAA